MEEMNLLERQLRSWTPRRPSAKIARRLFGGAGAAPSFLHAAEMWGRLATAAACALTLMTAAHEAGRSLPRPNDAGNAAGFATLLCNAASSNLQRTFVLSQLDENVEWNFWPHPLGHQTFRSSVWSGVPTNR